MFHMPVDVNATFNVQGRIKPIYIRLEDEEHVLQTYKIESIVYSREENFAGIPTMVFCCNIRVGDCMQMINIKYHVKTRQWVLTQDKENKEESTNA
jgi:hypothetical protein